jgi:hypothetical protein
MIPTICYMADGVAMAGAAILAMGGVQRNVINEAEFPE